MSADEYLTSALCLSNDKYLTGSKYLPTDEHSQKEDIREEEKCLPVITFEVKVNVFGFLGHCFWISWPLFLDFSVIFLDFSNALSNHCIVAWKDEAGPKGHKLEIGSRRGPKTYRNMKIIS